MKAITLAVDDDTKAEAAAVVEGAPDASDEVNFRYLVTAGAEVGGSLQSHVILDRRGRRRVLELDALGDHAPKVGSKLNLRLRHELR